MSIITKTGDDGTTALMYGRRVPKNHPRIEVSGSVDELTCALGVARAGAIEATLRDSLLRIQQDLIGLMGEVATAPEDWPRYQQSGFAALKPEATARLESEGRSLEAQLPRQKDWAIPGATGASAALDLARAICRRAERQVCGLRDELQNLEALRYLNRLSDLLWLMARWVERKGDRELGSGPTLV